MFKISSTRFLEVINPFGRYIRITSKIVWISLLNQLWARTDLDLCFSFEWIQLMVIMASTIHTLVIMHSYRWFFNRHLSVHTQKSNRKLKFHALFIYKLLVYDRSTDTSMPITLFIFLNRKSMDMVNIGIEIATGTLSKEKCNE